MRWGEVMLYWERVLLGSKNNLLKNFFAIHFYSFSEGRFGLRALQCNFSIGEDGDTQMKLITCSATCSSRERLMKGRKNGSNMYYCFLAPTISLQLGVLMCANTSWTNLNLKTELDCSFISRKTNCKNTLNRHATHCRFTTIPGCLESPERRKL